MTSSRHDVLDALNGPWATYLDDFSNLPETRKKEFLSKQGFTRFRDVVAHVAAWFDETYVAVKGYTADPAYKHPDFDVDAYNADAVARYGVMKEEEMWAAFESSRLRLVELTSELSDDALDNPGIQEWLGGDVVEHYSEHEF